MPCFIPNDRSKKRLIEDTEDWQPRTGTTQSRSFRILAQLTGTDFSKSGLRPEETRDREGGVGGGPEVNSRSDVIIVNISENDSRVSDTGMVGNKSVHFSAAARGLNCQVAAVLGESFSRL